MNPCFYHFNTLENRILWPGIGFPKGSASATSNQQRANSWMGCSDTETGCWDICCGIGNDVGWRSGVLHKWCFYSTSRPPAVSNNSYKGAPLNVLDYL